MKTLTLIFVLIPFVCFANTIDTNLLMTLNLDQMSSMVRKHINLSEDIAIKSQEEGVEKEREGDVIYELKKAALLVLARPNRDYMTVKLLPDVEKHLNSYNAFHPTLSSLVKESARVIADDEAPIKVKSAYFYVVENIIAELKPQVEKKSEAAVKVYKHIAEAKIKIPKKLSDFRRLEKMEEGDFNPSGYAQSLLDTVFKAKKKKPWWKFW